jgi:hypothetical protein
VSKTIEPPVDLDAKRRSKEETAEKDSDAVRIKIAAHLIGYALEEFDLLVDLRGQPYASKKEGASNIAVPLDSLRYPLAARYYDEHDAPASTSAWPEAAQTLHGLALREERRPIYMRHGRRGRDDIVIDLGREDGLCVTISADGWGTLVAGEVPIKFRRADSAVAMPEPVRGRGLEHMRLLLGRSEIEWGQIKAWMISALRADTPCPALHLLGEQGSGKTVLAEALIALIDPGSPLGRPPGNEERLQNAAFGSRVYGIDNLTHLQPWLSDALCAIITGERERRRKLYTDATPFFLEIKSAVLITGISLSGAGPDLLERMLPIQLDKLDADKRREQRDIVHELEDARGEHFAGLLDATADVLRYVAQNPAPPNLPRMADYARVLHALDQVGESPGVHAYYVEVSPIVSAYEALDSTDFGADLFRWMEGVLPNVGDEWRDTASDLLRLVAQPRYGDQHGNVKIPVSGAYPHNPRGASAALRRLAPALRVLGVEWEPPPPGGRSHERKLTLRRVSDAPELPSDD